VTSQSQSQSPNFDRWQKLRSELVWTSHVRAFVKKADLVVFHFSAVSDAPSWYKEAALVEAKFVKKASGKVPEQTMIVQFAGAIRGGRKDLVSRAISGMDLVHFSDLAENRYQPRAGSWLAYLYPSQHTPIYSSLMAVPTGSSVQIDVCLDYNSNSLMAKCGIHGDLLALQSQKGNNHQTFNLDTANNLHNSARFGFTY
jgi:hypothetical protein